MLGQPVAHKDLFPTECVRTTFGSLVHKNFLAEHDALIVKRLREAGAMCIGKTNTPELQEFPSLCGMKVQDKAFNEEFGGISCE